MYWRIARRARASSAPPAASSVDPIARRISWRKGRNSARREHAVEGRDRRVFHVLVVGRVRGAELLQLVDDLDELPELGPALREGRVRAGHGLPPAPLAAAHFGADALVLVDGHTALGR